MIYFLTWQLKSFFNHSPFSFLLEEFFKELRETIISIFKRVFFVYQFLNWPNCCVWVWPIKHRHGNSGMDIVGNSPMKHTFVSSIA
ncbi:hyoscyamine 6-dioxygenase [Trifolium repens]|nr:hyoscyamine 6-dioxygenase [Trifolium repens]